MIKKSTRDSILSILKTSLRINKKLNDVFKKHEISEQEIHSTLVSMIKEIELIN